MSFEHKDNRGSVFKNTRMREGKQDPERTGDALIGGVNYWVDGWLNKDKSGGTYLSLSFRAKDNQPAAAQAAPPQHFEPPPEDDDDGIPF